MELVILVATEHVFFNLSRKSPSLLPVLICSLHAVPVQGSHIDIQMLVSLDLLHPLSIPVLVLSQAKTTCYTEFCGGSMMWPNVLQVLG